LASRLLRSKNFRQLAQIAFIAISFFASSPFIVLLDARRFRTRPPYTLAFALAFALNLLPLTLTLSPFDLDPLTLTFDLDPCLDLYRKSPIGYLPKVADRAH
jgi:hypothetical protein